MTHELAILLPAAGSIPLAAAWVRMKLRDARGGLRLHSKAPAFAALPASDGGRYGLADLRGGRALVLLFNANRCPGVKAYDERIRALHDAYARRGVRFFGVNSISPALYATESLAELERAHTERALAFPTLKDEDQRLAEAMGARSTPHVFVFDADLRLQYRGRIDNAFVASRATEHYLRDALDDVLAGAPARVPETLPLGCAIDRVRPRGASLAWWRRAHELSRTPS